MGYQSFFSSLPWTEKELALRLYILFSLGCAALEDNIKVYDHDLEFFEIIRVKRNENLKMDYLGYQQDGCEPAISWRT